MDIRIGDASLLHDTYLPGGRECKLGSSLVFSPMVLIMELGGDGHDDWAVGTRATLPRKHPAHRSGAYQHGMTSC